MLKPMLPRMRKTDLIGLVGLALLLVWTPAYYAQDPVEQGLTGGTEFMLPLPRDGDRIVLGLQIQEGDGPLYAYGPLQSVSFESPLPDDPPGATLRIISEYHPARFETHYFLYNETGRRIVEVVDADGKTLWYEVDGQGNARMGGGQCGTYGLNMLTYSGETFWYRPTEPGYAQTWFDNRIGMTDDGPCDEDRPTERVLNIAAKNGDRMLYGRHALSLDRYWDRFEAQARAGELKSCMAEYRRELQNSGWYDHQPPLTYGYSWQYDLWEWGRHTFRLKDPVAFRCDVRDAPRSWDWIDPRFPIPVGNHVNIEGPDGTPLVRYDLIPFATHEGDGPVLLGPQAAPNPEQDPPLTVPFASLFARDDPLVNGRTLAGVRDILEQTLEPSERDTLRGASPFSFGWSATGPREVPVSRMIGGPVIGPMNEVTVTVLDEQWSLAYATGGGTSEVYELHIRTWRDTGEREAQVLFPCRDHDLPTPQACVKEPPQEVEVLPIRTALIRVEEIIGTHSEPLLSPPEGGKSEFTFGPSEIHFAAYLGNDSRRGSIDAQTGQRLESAERPEEREPEPQILAPRAAVGEIVFHEPLAATAAHAGLLLVLFSIAARLWGGIKSGAATASVAALYAKIHKDAVLDHERRDGILTLIRQDPGLTLREVQSRLGYGWGSTVHHVETMIRNGLLADLRVHRKRHLFPVETSPEERRRVVAERDPALAAVLETVRANPGLSQRELLAHVTDSESAVSRLAGRLDALGLIERRRCGRSVRLYPKTT